MAALIARERHVREQPAHLGWVVVLDQASVAEAGA